MLGFLVNRANKVPQLQREFLVLYRMIYREWLNFPFFFTFFVTGVETIKLSAIP